MLVYMLGLIQRDADAHGVRPTPEVIADLLVEDLGGGAELRAEVPKAIAALSEAGAIMEQVSGIWQLQTKESAEWDRLYRAEERTLDLRAHDIARERNAALDTAIGAALKISLLLPKVEATWRAGSHDFARAKKYLPIRCPLGSATDGSRTSMRSSAMSPRCPLPTPAFMS